MLPPHLLLLAGLLAQAPQYSLESVVNSASNTPSALAPNTIVTIYGRNLAFSTASVRAGVNPPRELAGVHVNIDLASAELLYVSPTQINLRLSSRLERSQIQLQVVRDGFLGPRLTVPLLRESPELYADADGFLLATFPDGSLVTTAHPARPGDTVVLYGTGFGATRSTGDGLATLADRVVAPERFTFRLDEFTVAPAALYYIGLTPGFAGLFQVNITLPAEAPANPELRVSIGTHTSRTGVRLAFSPESPQLSQPQER